MGRIVDLWWLWAGIFTAVLWYWIASWFMARAATNQVKLSWASAFVLALIPVIGMWAFILLLAAFVLVLRFGSVECVLPLVGV